MSLGSDIFGYIAGAISILVTIYAIIYSLLPKNKIVHLLNLLEETEALYNSCSKEGLLIESPSVAPLRVSLVDYRLRTENLRTDALGSDSISFTEQCRLYAKGVSRAISQTSDEVMRLRGKVLSQSQERRAYLMSIGQLPNYNVHGDTTRPGPQNSAQQMSAGSALPPPPSAESIWTPPPRLTVEVDAESDVKLHARLHRCSLRRSRTWHLANLSTTGSTPTTHAAASQHARATSGESTANTLVAEPPTDECATAKEDTRRCTSPLPLPNCTPLKGSRARSRLHPVRALQSCCDAILKVLKARRRR